RGYSMTMKFQGALRAGVLIVAATAAAGCASVTSDQLDMVRTTAENALKTAQAAQQTADQARQAASGAQSTANEALQAAQAAQAADQATNQKLDRMFQQSQRK
ncbi:MAG TPA: Lpp/OprI family alanine-zipper lipoprotein, partial [Gammaproteobacteria bacterium]|nr:Lpp/OprI family alanine-zipper lipoprotein [Gammaproteobacteria bacterium]